jgi:WhiB family redox-sensing transcriptional regulator
MNKPQRLPKPLLDQYEWQDQALCRRLDVAVFFDAEMSRGARRARREEAAKRVCRKCPVIEACRRHALAAEDYGVWGGMTAQERVLARQQAGQAPSTAVPEAS